MSFDMKYIDIDRLRARIEKDLVFDNSIDTAYYRGRRDARWNILNLIDSLLDEPVDYAEELKKCKDNPLYFYDKYVKVKQEPAEWSEEDEEMLNSCISSIEEAKENRYAYKETDGDTSYDHEIAWLKSLPERFNPQPNIEICPHSIKSKSYKEKPAECIEDSIKFEEGFKTGRESGLSDGVKYVLDNLEDYGLCKQAEWSELNEKMLISIISDFAQGHKSSIGQDKWLKSLRSRLKIKEE